MRNVRLTLSVVICLAAIWTACGGSPTQPSPPPDGPPMTSPPRAVFPLSKTSFVAFGDSMTAGTVTKFNGLMRVVIAPLSYPFKLQALLIGRHVGQGIQVYNEGVGGERTADGLARLPGVLRADGPQVLLLFEGVNDVNTFGVDGISSAMANLQAMISEAEDAGLVVFVGTLLPQRTGDMRAYAPELIEPFNVQLKSLAARDQATLVDLYPAFAADMSLIGPDGLHPTADGYTKMAQIWSDAIESTLDVPPTAVRGNHGELKNGELKN